jgi:hypothetical protein
LNSPTCKQWHQRQALLDQCAKVTCCSSCAFFG